MSTISSASFPTAAIQKSGSRLRRTPGVQRSLDPDFCIAALGADAGEIVHTDLEDDDPFGATSVYARLIARDATLLGLGVSLNTNSFIHVIDSRLSSTYPGPVYGDRFSVDVIDQDGHMATVSRRAILPQFQRLTQPSCVAHACANDPETFTSRTIDGALFFRWRLSRWSAWCDADGRAAAAAANWPCWLSRLGAAHA